jgi:secreted PhoX family phosphatase
MTTTRRTFLRTGTLASLGVLTPSIHGLIARLTGDDTDGRSLIRHASLGAGGYGPLVRAGAELDLPEGFRYWILSEHHQPMSDGRPTPVAFDGMAAFPMPGGNIRLIRNHENRDTPDRSLLKGDPALTYDPKGGGGTSSLEVRIGDDGTPTLVRDFVSLSGTYINCAGGPTPWGSWLSCEETVAGPPDGFDRPHGYVFEVPAASEVEVAAVPLPAMGRFVHEAVAVDPATGIVYLTEDQGRAGFYRFLPNRNGNLRAGGALQMLRVIDQRQFDTTRGQTIGRRMRCDWVPIDNPDPTPTDIRETDLVFRQGWSQGAARFIRLEGCWQGDGGIFFHSTSGGDAQVGQVWFYRPTGDDLGELTLLFESPSPDVLDYPDNLTVSPRGGIVMCEDGAGEQYLRGLTPTGEIFDFARNTMNRSEFCGACFAPDGQTLFVNIQGSTSDAGRVRGATFAIRGPWERGAL